MARSSTSGMGRPKGVPNRITRPIRELAAQHSPQAIQMLINIMGDSNSPTAARVSAAKELLDRAHGRPSQSMSLPMRQGSLAEQGQAAITAATAGQLPLDHLAGIMSALSAQARLVESADMEDRLEQIEAWMRGEKSQ